MLGLNNISKKIYSILIFCCIACSAKQDAIEEPVRIEVQHVVKKGETIEDVLIQILKDQPTQPIINALKNTGFPFKYCIPGDSIKCIIEDNRLTQMVYAKSITCKYFIRNEHGYYCVAMEYPYIDTITCLIKGCITSTLYEALLEQNETPNLVYRFADVFAWEIDFVTETQKNDSFYILLVKTYCDSAFIGYQDIITSRYKGEIGDYYGIYYKDASGHEDYYNLKGESLRKSLLKSPLKYSYISSYFSKRRFHPILKVWRPHHGLDYCAPIGTPVSSIGDGVVSYRGWRGGYGNLVEIKHKNNFKTRYGHLSKFAKGIKKGMRVKMGQLIGYVGSTGLSTGPHLHFELHENGVPINPLKVKIPRAPSIQKEYMADYEEYRDSLLQFMKDLIIKEKKLDLEA